MSRASRSSRLLRVSGALVLGFSVYLVYSRGITGSDLLLFILASSAGWLHFSLVPTGRISLSPIAVFVSLLTQPYSAPLIAAGAALFSSIVFLRLKPQEALEVVFHDTLATLGALAVITSFQTSVETVSLSVYTVAALAFIVIKTVLEGANAYLFEGVGLVGFASRAGRQLALNLTFFAMAAYAVRVYLYDQFGFLALALATVALAEIYHPWKLLSEQDDVLLASLAMVAQAIDIKDPYTARHSRNVADVAVRIARAMNLPEEEVRRIRIGALMHDIGKVGVNASIIRKPMKLEPEETARMRQHPVLSADIMQPIELLESAAEIVRHHHEHYDGTGYPSGLAGEEIPLGSRIILVADAFDAMTTDRPYRKERSIEDALMVLREHAGRQFDSQVVRALEGVLARR